MLTHWIARPHELTAAPGRKGRTIALGDYELRALSVRAVREWHSAGTRTGQAKAKARAARAARSAEIRSWHPARAWARENGLPVKPTGKLSASVLTAWRATGAPVEAPDARLLLR